MSAPICSQPDAQLPSGSTSTYALTASRRTFAGAVLLGLTHWHTSACSAEPPALMLANSYRPGIALADYWVSEKLDGVRGYWDGTVLRTRGGETVMAPAWFTAGWPKVAMDGELWAGRNRFSHAVSTVRQQKPDDAAWRNMRFMVFDLPAHGGIFTERIPALQQAVAQIDVGWVRAVVQSRVATNEALRSLLVATTKAGGEGLMLHRGGSLYRASRTDDLLKFKLHDDAEALVIAHEPGRGKYAGMLGALVVETSQGKLMRLGSGFDNAQRLAPPAVGSWVTYRYRGLNDSGIPRFATFMRVREEMPPR